MVFIQIETRMPALQGSGAVPVCTVTYECSNSRDCTFLLAAITRTRPDLPTTIRVKMLPQSSMVMTMTFRDPEWIVMTGPEPNDD